MCNNILKPKRKRGTNKITSKNSFVLNHPELLKEWDYDKNEVDPSILTRAKNTNYHWVCSKCEHKWETKLSSRTVHGSGCPKCNVGKCLKENRKNNILPIKFPKLLKEWDYENNSLNPYDITCNSNRKVKWICECGKSYEKSMIDICIRNRKGCKQCRDNSYKKNKLKKHNTLKNQPSSIVERKFFYYIQEVFGKKTKSGKNVPGTYYSMDILIDKLNLCIEYDGAYFHKDKIQKDKDKTKYLNSIGIDVLRIRENELKKISDTDISHNQNPNDDEPIKSTLFKIFEFIKSNYKVTKSELKKMSSVLNIDFNDHDIPREFLIYPYVDNSLFETNKDVAKDWCEERNLSISPKMFTENSSKTVYWKPVKCGHVFKKTIRSYCKNKICPCCKKLESENNKKTAELTKELTKGFNKKTSIYKTAAEQYNLFGKHLKYINDIKLPVSYENMNGTYEFVCKEHGVYKSTINGFIKSKYNSCTGCLNKSIYSKNRDIVKDLWSHKNVIHFDLAKTHEKHKWECNVCNNDWESTLHLMYARIKNGYTCQVCKDSSDNRIFYTKNKKFIDKYFDHKKNLKIKPHQIRQGVKYEEGIYFHCNSCDVSWSKNRLTNTSCKPMCSCGVKTFHKVNPYVIDHLNTDKIDLNYYKLLTHKSANEIHMHCKECGSEHSKKASSCGINVNKFITCNKCNEKMILENKLKNEQKKFNRNKTNAFGIKLTRIKNSNKFVSDYPTLLLEWDLSKNISPANEIPQYTNKKAFWKCHKCGHEWKSRVDSRVTMTERGSGKCPSCKHK